MDGQDKRDGMGWMMGTGWLLETKAPRINPIVYILSIHASPLGGPGAGVWAGGWGANGGNWAKLG